jgi:hypothetical protein
LASKKSRKRRRQRRPGGTPPPNPASRAVTRDEAAARAAARRAVRRREADPDRRPPAPWEPFPLVELMVLVAIVLLIGGFVVRGHRGTVMIGAGLVLGSLGGLELSVREHFGGFRSHTALIAGAIATVVAIGLTVLVKLPVIVAGILALIVFFGSARWLVRVFQRRSGLSFKFR